MVLAELTAGHIGRNGRGIQTPPDSDTSDHGKWTARTPAAAAPAALLPTPSSIQSMLRNGTETGDVGELAFGRNRKASPGQRPSPPKLSSSVPPSTRQKMHLYRDGVYTDPTERADFSQGISFNGPRGTTSSSTSTFLNAKASQASFRSQSRGPSRGSEMEHDRSYAMMHSSSTSRSIARHPVHMNRHLRNQGNARSMRPSSPLVYPTRLKRPGYRPSSPSLTEVYRAGTRSPFGLNRGSSFRTASPLSTYSYERPSRRFRQDTNRSNPLLPSYQAPLEARSDIGQYSEDSARSPLDLPRAYTRLPTPIPVPLLDPPNNILQVQQAPPSPPPLFYDYSEQFEQEVDHAKALAVDVSQPVYEVDDGRLLKLYRESTGLTVDEDAPVDTSISNPQTLGSSGLGQVNHIIAEESYRSVEANSRDAPPSVASETSVESMKEYPTVLGQRPSNSASYAEPLNIERSNFEPHHTLDTGGTIGHHSLSSHRLSHGVLNVFCGPVGGDENDETYHQPGLSRGSRGSLETSQQPTDYEDGQPQPAMGSTVPVGESIRESHELLRPESNAAKFSFESERAHAKRLSHRSDHATVTSFSRGSSSKFPSRDVAQNEDRKIHAPVPRRSLSSPGNRERFSSILSIDEALNELGEVAATSKAGTNLGDPTGISQTISTNRKINSIHPIASSPNSISKSRGIVEFGDDEPYISTKPENSWDGGSAASVAYNGRTQDNVTEPLTQEQSKDEGKVMHNNTEVAAFHLPKSRFVSKDCKPLPIKPSQIPASSVMNARGIANTHGSPRTMKELPPLPRSSVISVAPPQGRNAVPLPFSFTALRQEDNEEADSVSELGKLAASYLDHLDRVGTETPTSPPETTIEARLLDGSPPLTRPSSRPWNSEENYPWNDPTHQLQVTTPKRLSSDTDALASTKAPRFRLKLRRSSTSTTGGAKITKPRPSNESSIRKPISTRQRLSTSSDIFQATPFKGRSRPNPLNISHPGQNNSSRASPTPLNTRFVESFDLPAQSFAIQTSPSITLVPPSPGLNLEARSFFSDDSSQIRPKGSLRKRLSQFKATVTRASTSDDVRLWDQALLSPAVVKARDGGRSSRNSDRSQQRNKTADQSEPPKWRFVERVRAWFLHLVARKN